MNLKCTAVLMNLTFLIAGKAYAMDSVLKNETYRKEIKATLKQKELVIAVIDTGIDTQHPFLKEMIWQNPGEIGLDENGKDKKNNGVDDDQDGFVDDFEGWNFATQSKDVFDFHGHGTHVAGIIKKYSRNHEHIKILPLKYYSLNQSTENNLAHSVAAIKYAIAKHVDIINYSGGGAGFSEEENKVLKLAERNHIIVVAAAGNEAHNLNQVSYFPASYGLKNIFVIGSKDPQGKISAFSNFGVGKVDAFLDGENIVSSLPNGKFGRMSGTSQATAVGTAKVADSLLRKRSTQNRQTILFSLRTAENNQINSF